MTRLKEQIMRYSPAAAALALLVAVTSSTGHTAPPLPLDPLAAELVAQGRQALGEGRVDAAVDSFESALTVQPGHVAIYLNLGEATRRQGMHGKALHYYREALKLDPDNPFAIAGEGEALVEKGAIEKARRNLARLEQVCAGASCAAARQLSSAIARGPAPQVVTAEQIEAKPSVSAN